MPYFRRNVLRVIVGDLEASGFPGFVRWKRDVSREDDRSLSGDPDTIDFVACRVSYEFVFICSLGF